MDETQARQILKSESIGRDNELYSPEMYLCWDSGEDCAVLDGHFDADELEAIAWWMRNKGKGAT